MRRHDAILGTRGGHPDELLSTEVGRDESKTRYPAWQGATGEEELIRGAGVPLKCKADTNYKGEVNREDEVVDGL